MLELNVNIVDAFTDVAFKGNSAAVIIIDEWLPVQLMQSIAMEHNLSETAFVKQVNDDHFEIRWFSPITEVDFCGHATLAASFVIFNVHQHLKTINFYAKAVGDLSVTQQSDGYIQMMFPNRSPKEITDIPRALLDGLSIKPVQVLLNDQAYVVIYDNEADVLAVETVNEQLIKLAPHDVVVTAKSEEYDFISRYFWPANGGDEDPVTGSIHTGLAPYWTEKLNKTDLIAYQASKRGGKLLCRVSDENVYISGKAVQYLSGKITVQI